MTETVSDTPTYASNGIRLNTLTQYWPKAHPEPKLIGDVANLVAPWPWPVMSPFAITGGRINDYITENSADLHGDLGIFMNFASGTDYALWYHEGCVPGAEPVVCIDDEGQHHNLAPTLHDFFTTWAEGKGMGRLVAFDDDATPDLLADRQAKGAEILALLAKTPPPAVPVPAPDFYEYMKKYGETSRAANAANPVFQAIAKLLDAHIPRGREDWYAEAFYFTAKGDDIVLKTDVPEREALIPLIKQARAERAQGKTAALGPWTSAVLRLYSNGSVQIGASWGDV